MGKNLYETPRDRNKWNTSSNLPNKSGDGDAKKGPSIDDLKARFKKQQEARKKKK